MKRFGVPLALMGLFALLLLSSPGVADTPPAFRERDIWRQDLSTTANLLTSSLTPLTRGVVSTPNVSSVTYRFLVGIQPGAADSTLILRITEVSASTSPTGDNTTTNYVVNGGTALVAGQVYTFEFNGSAGFTYNFRVGTNTTIGVFSLDRVE